ncbi:MAG: transcriptional repressor [Deltaproteobacteria bacterium]|jgi:Fur family zinc uptake transcriptional regulator|nr:transcriptional repressor [Deltaproteobacteria bacterium]
MNLNKRQVDKFMAEAEKLCQLEGTQLTELRRMILERLIKAPGPVKAYDLIDSLRVKGRRITPSSVYRSLEFFIQIGLVHRVNALNAFVVCNDHGSHHNPVILVCPDCQATTEINDEGLYTSIFNHMGAQAFFGKDGSVEIRGLCKKCAKAETKSNAKAKTS